MEGRLGYLNAAKPLNTLHGLNVGLFGEWCSTPMAGWQGSPTARNMVQDRQAPNGTVSATSIWRGNYGRPGGYGSWASTGSSFVRFAFPAIGSTTDYTLALWCRPAQWVNPFTALFDDSARQFSLFFGVASPPTTATVSFTGTLFAWASFNSKMVAGSWSHFIMTRIGTAVAAYTNGYQVATGSANSATANAATVDFGDNPSTGGSSFDGLYDGIMLYVGRGMNTGDAQALYLESKLGNPNRWKWDRRRNVFAPTASSPPPPPSGTGVFLPLLGVG